MIALAFAGVEEEIPVLSSFQYAEYTAFFSTLHVVQAFEQPDSKANE
jgi:hypothetical protein